MNAASLHDVSPAPLLCSHNGEGHVSVHVDMHAGMLSHECCYLTTNGYLHSCRMENVIMIAITVYINMFHVYFEFELANLKLFFGIKESGCSNLCSYSI